MITTAIDIPHRELLVFSRKWKLRELALFGSVLGESFNPESDIDILVEFCGDSEWDSYDWIDMIDELRDIFGRKVDLVSKEGLRNPYRRNAILDSRHVIYAT